MVDTHPANHRIPHLQIVPQLLVESPELLGLVRLVLLPSLLEHLLRHLPLLDAVVLLAGPHVLESDVDAELLLGQQHEALHGLALQGIVRHFDVLLGGFLALGRLRLTGRIVLNLDDYLCNTLVVASTYLTSVPRPGASHQLLPRCAHPPPRQPPRHQTCMLQHHSQKRSRHELASAT